MVPNCSTSPIEATLQSNLSVITNLPFSKCFIQRPSSLVYFGNYITQILLLLPLCTLVLCIGFKRKQQQRSNSMAAKMSHSDCFTYHLVVMELVGVSGLILCCCSVFTLHVKTYLIGMHMYSLAWYGELFFHILTCVERFLAVVHPITYVSLKSERGVKIRNICTGVVWLLTVGVTGLPVSSNISAKADFFLVTFTLVIVSLCSFSVLYVLIRPRPGEQGAERERIDQSKKRAFFIILVILVVLLLRCASSLTWASFSIYGSNLCMIMASLEGLNIPSSVVLPLMFLQRAGLIRCCRKVK